MGLIKAGLGALSGTLADQWKEFFYCDSLDNTVIVAKGKNRVSGRSSNTKGNENIISNGSGIAVADGQCMIIVEQGKVVELCAEPGEFTFDASTEPTIFSGKLGTSIVESFKTIGKRFTYGGDTAKDQRVYYFNTKELIDNRFGTQNPVPFRVVDKNIGLDVDISIRCNGVYSYKIEDPLLFYANVCGNVEETYLRETLDNMLKSEFLSALQPAFSKISDMGIRYSSLPGHTEELSATMNTVLSPKWAELRGLHIVSVAVNSITASKEDEEMIKKYQSAAIMRDPTMAAATLVAAQADAMKAAASNEGGAMMGFMGLGMAQNATGMNAQNLYAMGQQQQVSQPAPNAQQPAQPAAAPADSWTCSCGAVNTSKFCSECATPKPAEVVGWTCACGAVNKGKFCSECATPKPAGAPVYQCDKCGWEPEDKSVPPKFCPECGDVFDDSDIK